MSEEEKETKKQVKTDDTEKQVKTSNKRNFDRTKKRDKGSDNAVYIGKRPTMNYVMACMVVLNRGVNCTIKARGRSISHAVDVAEILTKKFFPTAHYIDIIIDTEVLTNDDGRASNVSSMEIVVSPKGKEK